MTHMAWGLVFADDSLWHLPLCHFWEEAALVLLFLIAVGVPIKWPKTRIGLQVNWVGFEIRFEKWWAGLSDARCADLMDAARPIIEQRGGEVRVLRSFVGKLVYACQVHGQLRPLLQPLFACLAAAEHRTTIVWPSCVQDSTHMIVTCILQKLGRRVWRCTAVSPEVAASDGSGGLTDLDIVSSEIKESVFEAIDNGCSFHLGCRTVVVRDCISVAQERNGKRQTFTMESIERMRLPYVILARTRAGIGGWRGPSGQDKFQMRWFSEEVSPDMLPWPFTDTDGKNSKSGSSSTVVELLAAAVLVDFV